MAKIVVVHGVGQQLAGPETLLSTWGPALRDGLQLAGRPVLADGEIACGFYGDLFRPQGIRGLGDPELDASDVEDGFERELLVALWAEAARVDEGVPGPDAATRARTPRVVQRALDALSHARFFAGLAERALVSDLKQVRRYLHEPRLRELIGERVAATVTSDTRVLVGHSLGSVVAYEALCAARDWPVGTLVTLGSPLGIRRLIFDRLQPSPVDGHGAWPGTVRSWTNIADQGDVVALVKRLGPLFQGRVVDLLVDNGARAHDVTPYLTARETGRAIALGLAG
jgi:hypothetical protein